MLNILYIKEREREREITTQITSNLKMGVKQFIYIIYLSNKT